MFLSPRAKNRTPDSLLNILPRCSEISNYEGQLKNTSQLFRPIRSTATNRDSRPFVHVSVPALRVSFMYLLRVLIGLLYRLSPLLLAREMLVLVLGQLSIALSQLMFRICITI